ncbi:MAG: o-succinylbenzoate synthase [Chloroflexi bacterium]|nr:MAG: o-succinylbenzoate synthase [Chloroflexota bacterium]
MKIESAELRIIKLKLLRPFQTSFGTETERTIPLLTLCGEGLEGYAEGVMEVRPLYREEFLAGAIPLIKEALLPQVMGIDLANPQEISARLAMFRGNRMAKAIIEMAFWDLWAKSLEQPLGRLLGGQRAAIPVGVSLGIQKSLEATREQVQIHLDQGYQRIKLKIKPGWDTQMIRFVREEFPDADLTVDANSAYSLADIHILRELDQFRLDYIEQPLAYDDIIDHARLQSQISTSICLDESILSVEDTRKALELNAGRVINIKVARVGGHQEARRVHDVAQSFGVPVWCGGMLEGGVGRAHNIHLATLPNFTKPGDTSSSSRYWQQDIINELLETKDGWMPVPQGPGIGVTLNRPFIDLLTVVKETIRP